MFILIANVLFDIRQMCRADGKHPVSPLPIEVLVFCSQLLHEFGRLPLHLLHEFDGRVHLAHVEENVHMVSDTSNYNIRRFHASNNRCEVGMNARSYFVIKGWVSVFSAED